MDKLGCFNLVWVKLCNDSNPTGDLGVRLTRLFNLKANHSHGICLLSLNRVPSGQKYK